MRNLAFCLGILTLTSLNATWCTGQQADHETRLKSPRIVAQVSETVNSDSGEIPPTTFITPGKSGLYRVSYYWIQTSPTLPLCNPADCFGQLFLTFHWTDDAGTQSSKLSNNGSWPAIFYSFYPFTFQPAVPDSGQIVVRVNAGTPLQYEVTGVASQCCGNSEGATYELFFTVEQLQ